ncbi:MAG: hypothetical protein A2431_00780 [Candidatus Zambryskibacteria bacterium RIFOXYC1_FULL_39_10]|uniref:Uncharacterized protein n=1 Tax=Candidatus Zambryskibacteria bacterium RIFOXYC1_FULL_39_10 TaxID=1802779 RepID=A0A1G2V2D4_9BACT|nr:MAG: hypothetical protein A2605_02675 [Candidatus Zambryskibacteria bacterium RIFOXYD1_FULL_39_35]OHB15787.1 MAG: hypothetical protein A2431_00780 [Candidatus Zambryskibacteria bacterium RIFOXYC1_FULL_39_10]
MDYLKFKRKFFGFLREFFADMADQWSLICLRKRTEALNEDIELDKMFGLEKDIHKELYLEVTCLAHNKILARIKAREERGDEVVQYT